MPKNNLSTKLLHHAYRSDSKTGAIAVPIYQTSAYEFTSAKQAADLFALKDTGFIYSRIGNPTVDILEKRLAILEGGVECLALSSGQSAINFAICNIAQNGDNIVASPAVYGGVFSLFVNVLNRFGIEVRFADPDNPEQWAELTDDKTRAYHGEIYPNPRFKVLPIQEIANVAKRFNIPFIVDNTCSPIICRPFEHGANIIVHSTTKYISGHGCVIGGCIIDNGTFDWKKSPQNPMMNESDPTYHGLVWADLDIPSPYITRARCTLLRDLGSCVSPNDAFLSLQGLETLTLRMDKHCQNAKQLATYLDNHPMVEKVVHTSNETGIHKDWTKKYMDNKSAMLGVYIKGNEQQTKQVVENMKVFYHAANIGDNKSLVIHPASTTHSQLDEQTMQKTGITANYIRVSVGIEDVQDLIDDFDQALISATK